MSLLVGVLDIQRLSYPTKNISGNTLLSAAPAGSVCNSPSLTFYPDPAENVTFPGVYRGPLGVSHDGGLRDLGVSIIPQQAMAARRVPEDTGVYVGSTRVHDV